MAILDEVLQTLEIQPTGIPTVVRLSQNENGRQIRLTLRGQETDFPAGCLVTISGTKPDGVVYSAEGSLDGNVAVINEDTQMTAVAGMWKARVNVTYGGSTIATELIVIEVYADPVDPESVPSESELNGLVAEAQYWAENARSSAYGSPLVTDTAADMIETDRVYVYTGSESGYTAGHWYYYNGSAWTDGGIYNAAAVQTDTTLSVPGMAADAKATGDAIAAEAARATAAEGAIAADVAEAAGDIEDIQTDLTGVHGDIDALEDVVPTKADKDGNYTDLTAGTALAVLSDLYMVDAVPYKFRRTPYKSRRLMDEIVGGSVVWNQLVPTQSRTNTANGVTIVHNGDGSATLNGTATARGSFTIANVDVPIGHAFLFCGYKKEGSNAGFFGVGGYTLDTGSGKVWKNATTYASLPARLDYIVGDTFSDTKMWLQIFDLTQMFGTTIADYIYTLEQATAGAGVALFRSLFGASYYPYNAGELISISGLSARKAVGFNAFNRSAAAENKVPVYLTGALANEANSISSDYIHVLKGVQYYFSHKALVFGYDKDKTYLGCWHRTNGWAKSAGTSVSTLSIAYGDEIEYVKLAFRTSQNSNADMTKADISVSLSASAAYEPYEEHVYPFDSTLTLRGIPKLDSNNKLYFDGDRYASDGTVTRRYGTREYQSGDESLTDAITDGTNTVYKLTTATTETAGPYINPQYCSANGTEEYISETVVPVGHESKYYRDLDAVIPDAPTADGVYTLKCTVSGGVPSYSWEV